jgi:hypothetical protein
MKRAVDVSKGHLAVTSGDRLNGILDAPGTALCRSNERLNLFIPDKGVLQWFY